jgi:predicted cupin superfamily sugar epimerase
MLTKRGVIEHLNMRPHEEGGFASPTYSGDRWSVAVPGWPGGERAVLNSILYMLTDDAPVGVLHRNPCDIVHFFTAGTRSSTSWSPRRARSSVGSSVPT